MNSHHLMSFHWDTEVGVFLFPGLNIGGAGELIILCIVLVIFCVLYESVKVFQTQQRARTARERRRPVPCPASETANLLAVEAQNLPTNPRFTTKLFSMLSQALVFLCHNTVGYMLMLSVMVYNVYVFFAIILGLGLGYFLFGHISMKINMENIRARTTTALCASTCPAGPSTSGAQNPSTAGHLNSSTSSSSVSSSTESNCHTNYSSISHNPDDIEIHPSKAKQEGDSNIEYSCRL